MSGFIPSVTYFKNFANIALFAIFFEATNGFFPSLLHKRSSLDVARLFFVNAPLLIPVTFCITFTNTVELCQTLYEGSFYTAIPHTSVLDGITVSKL